MISPKFKRSFPVRATSLFLAFTFCFYNVSFAAVEKEPVTPDVVVEDGPLLVEDIGIAIDVGTIKSKYSGDTGRVIVHIQDAHCNYEAQDNINKILDQLTKECGLDLISVEGAEGIVDTSWFRAFPDVEIRKEVATYFMKKGEITGAEFFSITGDFSGTIFGAETREYYVENLRAFTEVYPYKEQIESYFLNLRTIANRLKTMVYPPKLREVDSKIMEFKDKEIELSDYAEYLSKSAKQYKVNIKDMPNFEKLMKTLEYEHKIDFDIVDKERSDYIDLLSKKMDKKKMTELVTESVRFKKGHIKSVDFYTYLRDLAREYNIEIIQEYPNLFYYYIYTKLYDGIDNEGLFKEIDIIQERIKDKLFKTETERTLDKYSDLIDMYVDLVNIELTNDDYDRFNSYIAEFNIEDVVAFINSLCQKYNLNYPTESIPEQIKENIPNMVSFYEIAMKRDHALIENTINQMEKMAQDRCVLIAGGFHTRGIKDILEKQGISYVVVTPKITKDVETPYIKVLTNQRTSLEDIISESVAMPGGGVSQTEKGAQPAESFLAPVLRLFGVSLWLQKGAGAVDQWQANVVAEGVSMARVATGTFDEAVEMAVNSWIERVKERREIQLINEQGEIEGDEVAAAEWNDLVRENVKWAVLLNRYLTLYRDGADVEFQEAAFKEAAKEIKIQFTAYRDRVLKGTPGTGAAEGGVVEVDVAKKIDKVIKAAFDARAKMPAADQKKYVIRRNDIRDGFVFQLHDGLVERLVQAGLPTDIRPGRGGEVLKHKGLQAHIDAAIYEALTPVEREAVARHELAHLDIFNAEERYHDEVNVKGRSVSKARARIKDELGTAAYDTWLKWVEAGRPEGMNQEDFINGLEGHDVRSIHAKINTLVALKRAAYEKKKALVITAKKADMVLEEGEDPEIKIEPDEFGNLVYGKSFYPKDGTVRNSVIINTRIYGKANINDAIFYNSDIGNAQVAPGAVVYNSTVRDLTMDNASVSVMSVEETLDVAVSSNATSMSVDVLAENRDGALGWRSVLDTAGIANQNLGTIAAQEEEIDTKVALVKRNAQGLISRADYLKEAAKPLRVGTSGMRDLVTNLTDYEVYINARKFVRYLVSEGELADGDTIYVAGDLRGSTDDIMTAIGFGIYQEAEAQGMRINVAFAGKVPSPAVSYAGFSDGFASVMVTGSHIPDDRNGIKFNKKSGEVLDTDVPKIKALDDAVRGEDAQLDWDAAVFDELGTFKTQPKYNLTEFENEVRNMYRQRYTDAFPADFLEGLVIAQYQHSAVGRDDLKFILEALGAKVIAQERSDNKFVPVDTEKVSPETRDILAKLANLRLVEETTGLKLADVGLEAPVTTDGDANRIITPDAVVSSDGDADRPILADENGVFLPGDKLGLLVALYLKPDFVALPISTNDAVVARLEAEGITVVKTKIGSPKVIKAMNDYLAENPDAKVVAWEANGGFLLGGYVIDDAGNPLARALSPWQIEGGLKRLTPLPTRDVVLPLLAAMKLALQEGQTIAELINEKLRHPDTDEHRYNTAGVFDAFGPRFGVEGNEAFDLMDAAVKHFAPTLEDALVVQVDFSTGKALRLKNKDNFYIGKDSTEEIAISSLSQNDIEQWNSVRENFNEIYSVEGFEEVVKLNTLDGIQITFANMDVSHLRPSGNAPEFRNYSVANASEGEDVQVRAKEIVELGVTKIIPAMVETYMKSAPTPAPTPTPGVYAATGGRFTEAVETLNATVKERFPIKFSETYMTAKEGYTWGAIFKKDGEYNALVNLLGEQKIAELRKSLAGKYGISEAEVDELALGERWVSAGDVEVTLSDGSAYLVPAVILALWGEEVFGAEHLDRIGSILGITAKGLNSGVPLSVQYHRFDEMIIPVEDGIAYIGLNKDVTPEEIKEHLMNGTIQDIMNSVEVKAGVPYIVPAYMLHAYAFVSVYEVKAVNADKDKAGTVSFYDRLKYLDDTKTQGIIEDIVITTPNLDDRIAKLTNYVDPADPGREPKILVREGKDVLTMPEEKVDAIIAELAQAGALNSSKGVDDVTSENSIIYPAEVVFSGQDSVYKVMGMRGDFVTGKYELGEKALLPSYKETVGRPHSLFVMSGRVEIRRDGQLLATLNKGDEIMMPAYVGEYELVTIGERAEIFTQYIPAEADTFKDGQAGDEIARPFESKVQTEVLGQKEPSYVVKGVFDEYGVSEVVEVNTKTDWADGIDPAGHSLPQILADRDFTLVVQEGNLGLNVAGVALEENGKPVYFESGTRILISKDKIISINPEDEKIKEFPRGEFAVIDLVRQPGSDGSALVKMSYPKTDDEKTTYAVFRAVFKNMGSIIKTRQVLIYPEETFVEGDGPGSRQWLQGKMNEFFGRDTIEIRGEGYKAYKTVDGKKVAKSLSEIYADINKFVADAQKDGRRVVLGTVQTAIDNTTVISPEMSELLGSVRVSAMPDLEKLDGGWYFIQEAIGVGMLQAILTADNIKKNDSLAQDVLKVMKQVSGPNVQVADLYRLLPFGDAGIPQEILDLTPNTLAWMKQLVHKLLLKMPVQPFNALDQLEQRRRIMWSV